MPQFDVHPPQSKETGSIPQRSYLPPSPLIQPYSGTVFANPFMNYGTMANLDGLLSPLSGLTPLVRSPFVPVGVLKSTFPAPGTLVFPSLYPNLNRTLEQSDGQQWDLSNQVSVSDQPLDLSCRSSP